MKKISLASSFVLTCLVSQVSAAWEGSPLAGISGGWVEHDGNVTATVTHPVPGPIMTTFITKDESSFDNGYLIGLLAGYEFFKNNWIIGLEVNLDWHDKRHKSDDNILAFTDAINQGWMFTPHYKTNAVLAISARLGYQLFTYFTPYVRLGPEYSSNRLRFYAYDPVQALFVEGDSRRYMTRLLAGIGAQIPIPIVVPGMSIRMEYNYHSRGKEVDSEGLASPDYATLWDIKTKPRTDSVKASLVWNLPV